MTSSKWFLIVIFQTMAFCSAFPQAKDIESNIEVFYSLADSTAALILSGLPESKETILFRPPHPEYSILSGRISRFFSENGIKTYSAERIAAGPEVKPAAEIAINFDNASVEYTDMHRGSIFGSLRVKRTVRLEGIYSAEGVSRDFSFLSRDTVLVDQVKKLESSAFTFTRADLPPEPFFSSLIEPAVAIGTAAVAVYLFFSVRSK